MKRIYLLAIIFCFVNCAFTSLAKMRYWIGETSDNWEDASNWSVDLGPSDGLPPQPDDHLVFDGHQSENMNPMHNQIPNLKVRSMIFRGSNDHWIIQGNTVEVSEGIITAADSEDETVDFDCGIRLGGDLIIAEKQNYPFPQNENSFTIRLLGPINLNGHTLTLLAGEKSAIEVSGMISGAGNVIAKGMGMPNSADTGYVIFDGPDGNTFSGSLTVTAGWQNDGQWYTSTVHFNKQSGVVVNDRLRVEQMAIVTWDRSDQVGTLGTIEIDGHTGRHARADTDNSSNVTVGGTPQVSSGIDLNGHNQIIGNLTMINSSQDVLPAFVFAGNGAQLTVRTNITGTAGGDLATPIIKGSVLLAGARNDPTNLFTYCHITVNNPLGHAGLIAQAGLAGGSQTDAIVDGDGALVLTGENSFNGFWVVLATLDVQNSGSLAQAASVIVQNSLILRNVSISGPKLQINGSTPITPDTTGGFVRAVGSCAWNGPIELDTDLALFADNLALNGQIIGSHGMELLNGDIVIGGTAPNTYTGPTLVHCELLELNKPAHVVASTGPLVVGGGGNPSEVRWRNSFQNPRLALSVFANGLANLNDHDDEFGDVILNGGHVETGNGTLTFYEGLTVLPSSTTAIIEGQVQLPAPNIALFDVGDGTADPDLYIGATLNGGAPRLVKKGPGTVRFGLANKYIGQTEVDQGVLQIDSPDSLSPVSAGLVIGSGGTLLASGFGATSIPITLQSATAIDVINGGTITFNGPVTLLEGAIINVGQGASLGINSVIDGDGPLTKVGPGNLVLGGTAPNTYSGDTIVKSGTLVLNKTPGVAAVPGHLIIDTSTAIVRQFRSENIHGSVTVDHNALWDLNDFEEGFTVAGLEGHVPLTLKNGGKVKTGAGMLQLPLNGDILVSPGSVGASSISGNIGLDPGPHHFTILSRAFGLSGAECTIDAVVSQTTGSADLVKDGPGRLVLTAANTYSGNTIVATGVLQIDGTQRQSPISITGGTLQGAGAMGPITMSGPTGILAPHISAGTIICDTLSAGPGGSGTLQIQLSGVKPGTEYDQVVVHGPCNLNGITLNASLNFHSAVNDKFIIIQAAPGNPIQGTFNGLPEGATLTISGQQFNITYAAAGQTQVVLTHLSEFTGPTSFWIKSQSGDWNDPPNWDTQTVPNASNAGVTNNDATPFTINNSANVAIAGLLYASPEATIAGTGDLNMSGLFSWQAGLFTNASTLRPSGGLYIGGAAAKTLGSKTLFNTAAATWSDDGQILFTDGAVLQNAASGTFECTGDGSIQNGPGSNLVFNAGVFRKTGGSGTTEIDVPFNNTGTVEVLSGTLLVNNGGTNMGSYVVSSGKSLLFGRGTYTFTAASAITGSGNLSFSSLATVNLDGLVNIPGIHSFNGGTVNLNGDYNFDDNELLVTGGALNLNGSKSVNPATLTLNSFGTLGGSAPVTVSGLLTWGGSSTIGGDSNVVANGGINFSGGGFLFGRTLINNAGALWKNDTAPVTGMELADGAVLLNASGATFVCASTGIIENSVGANAVVNEGLFRTTGPTNQFRIDTSFNNSGAVDIESAMLSLSGGGEETGQVTVAAGSTLNLMNGTHNFAPTSIVTGEGNLQVSGGVANLAGTVNLSGSHNFAGGIANISGNYSSMDNSLIISGGTANFDGTGTVSPAKLDMGLFGVLGGSQEVTVSGLTTLETASIIRGKNSVIANGGLKVSGGIVLEGRTLVNNAAAIWTSPGPAAFTFENGATLVNSPAATFDLAFDGILGGGPGANAFINSGLFRKSAGTGSADIQVPFVNTGTVEIDSGTLNFSTLGPYVQNDGVTRLNGGNIATALPLKINGGVLEGSGLISGSVINAGVVRPGKIRASAAFHSLSASGSDQLIITGDYVQTADGVLEVELGGANKPLVVSNSVALAGLLNVTLAPGATLSSNLNVALLSSTNVSGSFSQITFADSDAVVQLNLQGTNLTLQVANIRPTLAAIPDQTILSSSTLNLPTHATDPDLPAQTLTYRLLNSHANATIETNGLITWTPDSNSPRTNSFTVVVIDSGTPRLSVAQSFNVILSDRAAAPTLLLTTSADAHSYILSLVGTPGSQYVAQHVTNLPGLWLDFATNTAGTDGFWSVLDSSATNRARFYRARSALP